MMTSTDYKLARMKHLLQEALEYIPVDFDIDAERFKRKLNLRRRIEDALK